MRERISALVAGAIFGVGLCLSGMTNPENIIAFLDVGGAWSPNLAGVMLGAIAVHAGFLRYAVPGGKANPTHPRTLPAPARVDGALLGGSALFGVGWGLSGYCPGPAVVALSGGAWGTVVFVLAMLLGMALAERVRRRDVSPAP